MGVYTDSDFQQKKNSFIFNESWWFKQRYWKRYNSDWVDGFDLCELIVNAL